MVLTAKMEGLSEGKKIRRVDCPEGLTLQRRGAFISTPEAEENFKAWIEEDAQRKFVVYSDENGNQSRPSVEEVKALFSLHDPEAAACILWELAD